MAVAGMALPVLCLCAFSACGAVVNRTERVLQRVFQAANGTALPLPPRLNETVFALGGAGTDADHGNQSAVVDADGAPLPNDYEPLWATGLTAAAVTYSLGGRAVRCCSECHEVALVRASALDAVDGGARPTCTCYGSLTQAVAQAANGDLVQVVGDVDVYEEVRFAVSISLAGCRRSRRASGRKGSFARNPLVVSKRSTAWGSILRVTGLRQNITISNLSFRNGNGLSSAIRTWELPEHVDWVVGALANVSISNCSFTNFRTEALGGAAVFLDTVRGLAVHNTEFVNNSVVRPYERFGGMGAVWVGDTDANTTVTITNCTFADNVHEFEHGVGGGFGVDVVAGNMSVRQTMFLNNNASAGAAMYVQSVLRGARLDVVDSLFIDNVAWEHGWGSRGAATWIQFISGHVAINESLFVGNRAPAGRGGVVANNNVNRGARVVFDGDVFIDNAAATGGAVWDTLRGFKRDASVVFRANCLFEENVGKDNTTLVVRLGLDDDNAAYTMRQEDWAGRELEFYG